MNQLARRLNRLSHFLNDNFDLNHGGCCFFALCLAELLEKDNIPYVTIVVDSDSFNDIRDYSDGFYHIAISIDNIPINFNPDKIPDDLVYNQFKATASDLKFVYTHGSWSDTYDKHHNVFIKRIIAAYYNDYVHQ